MSSFQSKVVHLLLRVLRRGLFSEQQGFDVQRRSLDRASNLAKSPRFVRSEPVAVDSMKALWLIPRKCDDDRVILYLHGGAYCSGSSYSHRALAGRLARTAGCRALVIDYRLAPEHPFPAALEDALTAYQFLVGSGYAHIAVAGDSAGGGLAVSLLMQLRKSSLPMASGAVLLSPWTDLAMRGESIETKAHLEPMLDAARLMQCALAYAGDRALDDPQISPVYGELSGLPPVLIHVGGREILLDDATRLAKRLKKYGVQVELMVEEEMFHVWHYMGGLLPEAGKSIRDIGRFLRHLNRHPENTMKAAFQKDTVDGPSLS